MAGARTPDRGGFSDESLDDRAGSPFSTCAACVRNDAGGKSGAAPAVRDRKKAAARHVCACSHWAWQRDRQAGPKTGKKTGNAPVVAEGVLRGGWLGRFAGTASDSHA